MKTCSDQGLIDPTVLKKKLDKMSTELGAFAVLSSLLLYLTETTPSQRQVQGKKAQWLESCENKLKLKHERQGVNNGIRPTKFQLLQSRFMNDNREPYRKKTREVGKLFLKDKQSANRNYLNSIVSKLEGSSLTEDENPVITSQERVKWVGLCRKNNVKNILKKFLAAEEKEAKEKLSNLHETAPVPNSQLGNNNLPKRVNRNSVLSKLKEKFEQTSNICSATEVKALLPCKGEKRSKKFLEKRVIHKVETRKLQKDLMTAVNINSRQPQHLVCTTISLPKFCVATEVSHPQSWATNAKCATQPSDRKPELGKQNTLDGWLHEKRLSERPVQTEGPQKEQLQNEHCERSMKSVKDDKDIAATDVISAPPDTKRGNFPLSHKSEPLSGCVSNLSKDNLDHTGNVTSAAHDAFSNSRDKNAEVISKGHLSATTCPSSRWSEEPCAHSYQDSKGGGIPDIPEGVCCPKGTEIEFTEPVKDPPFASQKCFPEQKVLENIPLFCFPEAQASCNMEPPINDQRSSVKPAAVDKMSLLKSSQKNAQDFRKRRYDAIQKREKPPDQEEISSTPTPTISKAKREEPRPVRSQGNKMETKHLKQKPQAPPLPGHQNNKEDSNPNLSKPTASQSYQGPASNNIQTERSNNVKREQSIGEGKLCPVNEVINSENKEKEKSSLSHFDDSQMPLKELSNNESCILEQNSLPTSEKCHSFSLNHSGKPTSDPAEPQSSDENHQMLLSYELKNKNGIREQKIASCNSTEYPIPSPNEWQKPKGPTGGDNKTMCALPTYNNRIKSKNSVAEKEICPLMDKHQPPSTREIRKDENCMREESPLCKREKQKMPSENAGGKQENDAEVKPENCSFPSQNETTIQECSGTSGKRNSQKTAQHIIPLSADTREQEKKRTGGKEFNSKMYQKSIKSDLTKDRDDTVETNCSPTQQVPPSKQKLNSPGVLTDSAKANNKMSSSDPGKHGRVLTDDNTARCPQPSPREPLKYGKHAKGRNAQDNLKNDNRLSIIHKVKSENKTEDKSETGSNSGQNQLPLKNVFPKNKKSSSRDTNALGNPNKDLTPSNNETEAEKTNLAEDKRQKPSLNDFGNREVNVVAKNEKYTPLNSKDCQLSLPDMKPESHQNNRAVEKQKQQPAEPSKDYVRLKPSIRDEKHTRFNSEKGHPPSSNELNMNDKSATEKKNSWAEKCRARPSTPEQTGPKEKTELETETGSTLLSSKMSCPVKQRKKQRSSSKSSNDLSEAQALGSSTVSERRATLEGFEKYQVESYSERPFLDASFRPMVIRAIDTIKLDN